MSVELVSVHIPKTAGGTFLEILRAAFGAEHVAYEDEDRIADPLSVYNIDPERWQREARERLFPDEVHVLHGHFPVHKYWRRFESATWVTWLRHPVARLVSHYWFWQGLSPEHSGHSLHRYVLDHGLALSDFAALPMLRNFQSRFLGESGLKPFAFVGIQEHFHEDLRALGETLGRAFALPEEDVNRNPQEGYDNRRGEVFADAALLRNLEDLNHEDMELYEAGLRVRDLRR